MYALQLWPGGCAIRFGLQVERGAQVSGGRWQVGEEEEEAEEIPSLRSISLTVVKTTALNADRLERGKRVIPRDLCFDLDRFSGRIDSPLTSWH